MDQTLPLALVTNLIGVIVFAQALASALALVGVALWFNQRVHKAHDDCADEMQRQREEMRNSFERERLQMDSKIMQAFQQRDQMYQELRLHARGSGRADSLSINAEGNLTIGGDLTGRDRVSGQAD